MIDRRNMFQARQGQRPPQRVDIFKVELEVLLQDFQNVCRHGVVHLQTYYARKTPLPDPLLNRFHKIAGLKILDSAVRVSGYMEWIGRDELNSWKQARRVSRDGLL